VLRELGAIEEGGGTPMIEALNKIDALPIEQRGILQTRASAGPDRARQFPVSALSGEGVEQLLEAIEAFLSRQAAAREVAVPLSDGATIAWLYRHGEVRRRHDEGETAHLTVALDAAASAQFDRRLAR
jgi:GTPase